MIQRWARCHSSYRVRGRWWCCCTRQVEDVQNLPPIEEIHGLDNPTQVVEVNSLRRFNESDIPYDKLASLCLDEFDNFVAKQQSFNDYVSRQLEQNARMINHISACVDRNVNDLKLALVILPWTEASISELEYTLWWGDQSFWCLYKVYEKLVFAIKWVGAL